MGQRLVQAIISSQQQIVDNVARHRLGTRYVRSIRSSRVSRSNPSAWIQQTPTRRKPLGLWLP
jgi:hypothetical protein